MPRLSADAHNELLARATLRAQELEPLLIEALTPILNRAGREAARAFRATATDHLTAAAHTQADLDALARLGPRRVREALPHLGYIHPAVSIQDGAEGYIPPGLAAAATPGVTSQMAMIAVKPRPSEAESLAHVDGEEPGNLHVTLAFLGEVDGDLETIAEVLRGVAGTHAPLAGEVGGLGAFANHGDGHPLILLPDVPGLVELRQAVCEALTHAGVSYSRQHGYTAHVTVNYSEELELANPELLGQPLHFDDLLIVRGNAETITLPLVGVPPLTAAGAPGWTPPAGDEILNVDQLIAELRTKTDPVRLAVVETMMTEALDRVGLAFDTHNPVVANVIDGAGLQIVDIARTTQANVVKIMAAAYQEGLSIPDTAKLIRAGMLEATPARATLIARTEMVGAVQGGSLAATQLAAQALGITYMKEWLTAPGAKYPRHNTYIGLDHQTRELNQPFQVGGHDLQHPGDPHGPPEEVCNCFPGETLVVAPGTQMGYRRRYDGWLQRIKTDAGHVLAGTPNHPVLTDAGWKPLGDLVEGDRLVCGTFREDEAAVAPDVKDAPAAIEEVFDALARGSVTRRIRGSAMQFHGDGSLEGEVEVVAAHGALFDHDTAARLDPPLENKLVRGREPAAALAPAGFRADLIVGDRLVPASLVRCGSEGTTILWTGLGHADGHRGRSAAGLHAVLDQPEADRGAADAVLLGKRLLGSACEVVLAEIVSVEIEPFHGDVFNLQTESGAYLAAGIISHNCRCTLIYTEGEEAAATPGAAGGIAAHLGLPGD